jgi:hypothetical protein
MSAIRSRSIKSIRFLKIFDRPMFCNILFSIYLTYVYVVKKLAFFILKIKENIFIMTLKTSRLLTNETHKLKSIKSIDHEKS